MISGIIKRLCDDKGRTCRPILVKEMTGLIPKLCGLIEICWHNDPDSRPDFRHVYKRLKAINKHG
jgi:hypothetical protein